MNIELVGYVHRECKVNALLELEITIEVSVGGETKTLRSCIQPHSHILSIYLNEAFNTPAEYLC